jgi:hypothetical protein
MPTKPRAAAFLPMGASGTIETLRRRAAGIDLAVVAFAVVATISCAYLLYLGRHATFFNDEWVVIFQRSLLNLDDWFRPHNGHLSIVLVLVWRSLFELVGLHSYLPYLALLLVIHAIAAAGVAWLLRRLAGPEFALAGGLVFLVLGTAYENLFWSFQMGFVGSVAAGTWGLAALHAERPRTLLALALLLVSVGSSGMGLAFLAAAIVMVAVGPRPRERVLAVLIPSVGYASWYLAYARAATDPGGFAVDNLVKMPSWIHTGASRAVGGLTGFGDAIGGLFFLAVTCAVVMRLLRDPLKGVASDGARVTAVAAGAVAGIATEFLLIGLARGHLETGAQLVLAPRYMYVPAALFLIALAALIGWPPVEVDSNPSRLRRSLTLVPFALLAVVANVHTLNVSGVPYFEYQARLLRTSLEIADRYPEAPAILAGRFPVNVPPNVMRELISERGTPAFDVFYPGARLEPDANTYDQVLVSIVAPTFKARQISHVPLDRRPVQVIGTHVLTAAETGDCTALEGHGFVDSQVWFVAPSGSTHILTTDAVGEIQLYLSYLGEALEANSIRASIAAGGPLAIEVPDMGEPFNWTLRVKFPNGLVHASLCGLPPH